MNKLRKQKEYEGNLVGLSKETAKDIAKHLDRHLASLYCRRSKINSPTEK